MFEKERYLIETIRGLGVGLTVAGVIASLIQKEGVGYLITFFGLGLITYGLILINKE